MGHEGDDPGPQDGPAIRELRELQALRGSHAFAYYGLIDQETPRILYEYLRRLGRVPRLDLVLATSGGVATAARRAALLLHEYTEHLTILVAHRAWSAGTLLCLGAHELVLGPLAELGPIDPGIGSAADTAPNGQTRMSTEDVRAFRRLAEDWFGVEHEEHRLQVLALLAQRVFPGSLGVLYRSDKLVRQMAAELLEFQLPGIENTARDDLVDRLVSGYHAHEYAITRAQARDLGLRVSYPCPAEEELLWDVTRNCRDEAMTADGQLLSLVAGVDFHMRQIKRG